MKRNWPVRGTWRASFILCACITGAAWADGRAIVIEARTQDPARIDGWQARLRDGGVDDRAAAAFALGQLGVAWAPPPEGARARAEAALLAALGRERAATVRDRIVEALGKVGGRAALPALAQALDGPERARAAIALSILAKNRSLRDSTLTPRLARLLSDANAEARYGAALALSRLEDAAARPALLGCLGDRAVHVRATCAKALAEVGRDADAPALAPLLDDRDPRVAAEAARTLVKLAMRCAPGACAARAALQHARLPWRPAVAQAVCFEHWRGVDAAAVLRAAVAAARADRTLDPSTRARVACMLAMAHDRARGALELVPGCGAIEPRARDLLRAQALAERGGPALTALAASPYPAVRAAAAEGADAATTRRLLGDADPAVVQAAAERAAVLKLADAAPALAAALARLHGPDAVEAKEALLTTAAALGLTALAPAARALVDAEPYALRLAAAEALTTLTHTPVTPRLPASPSGAPPPLPPTVVRLRTTRGTIVARLWVEDAPRTAANFVALVRRHFYDGLTFHRVVPDFVSQGGDPKGDGSGGPGHLIPCEIGMRRYGEGVLGMALAGRDTGGSQFFFTHAPEPHLDGRYTAFGEVIEGRDVVSRLVAGDVILQARVETR